MIRLFAFDLSCAGNAEAFFGSRFSFCLWHIRLYYYDCYIKNYSAGGASSFFGCAFFCNVMASSFSANSDFCFGLLLSLLPASAGLGRVARIMGWIVASALILDGLLHLVGIDSPLFLVVVLISPPYFFLLGSWLKRISRGALVLDPARSRSASTGAT